MRSSRKLLKLAPLFAVASYGVISMKDTDLVSKFFNYDRKQFYHQFMPNHHFLVQAEEETLKPQSGVVTGNFPQMAIISIKLKDYKNYEKVLKAVSLVPSIVEELTGDKQVDAEDEFALPPVMINVALSTRFWNFLNSKDGATFKKPEGYTKDYETKTGEFGSMPYKETEIVLHVKAENTSICYQAIDQFLSNLPKDALESVNEHYGFQYQDSRDLSKFIDGINNPSGNDDRSVAALNSQKGSFLIHQKWVHHHHLDSKFSVKDQEAFVGRERVSGAELPTLPPSSHVARMRRPNGDIIPIVRQSFPYGTVSGEHGLLFIAYSNNIEKYETLLDAMVGKVHGKHNDAIMKFSNCHYSNYYYVPSINELNSIKTKFNK
ncbi:predicted protein [Naegleria gruberi]|uniref:Predicted protein n=1 Tax=Naegleria gruberi TaxID=5762 RepID=D2VIT8_NAEGR|nr:uncharacterized protein NAEGRDRAFT_82644 [Naegleria gruberi]EFC43331.1 predicted protein [Naegleria gruberi]|eukprot:XP_002676075.1 predicted protein [Naegleria gruberi strain NEG-M]